MARAWHASPTGSSQLTHGHTTVRCRPLWCHLRHAKVAVAHQTCRTAPSTVPQGLAVPRRAGWGSDSGRPSVRAQSVGSVASSGLQGVLFFEVEGVVVDLHMDGHRVAFNAAFEDLGYDCINWAPHVYHDLLSAGDGTPETLITNYFNIVGWPTMLATSDQPAFVKKVHQTKQTALERMLKAGKVPLRSGIKQVIEDAVAAGIHVVFMTGTLSESANLVATNALAQLSPDAASKVKVFNTGVVPQDAKYALSSHDTEDDEEEQGGMAQLRTQQLKVKTSAAQQFVSGFMQGGGSGALPISVDPSLIAAASRQVHPDWLAATAAILGVPVASCLVLTSSSAVTDAAASIGMPVVAVPRRMGARGSFPGALAKFTGFGPGDCTWGRLRYLMKLTPTPTRESHAQ